MVFLKKKKYTSLKKNKIRIGINVYHYFIYLIINKKKRIYNKINYFVIFKYKVFKILYIIQHIISNMYIYVKTKKGVLV